MIPESRPLSIHDSFFCPLTMLVSDGPELHQGCPVFSLPWQFVRSCHIVWHVLDPVMGQIMTPVPSPSPPPSHHHPGHISSLTTCQLPVPFPSLPPSHHHPGCISSLTTHQSPIPLPSLPPAHHCKNVHISSPACLPPSHHHPGCVSSLTTPSHCPSGHVSTSASASQLDAYMEAADESPTLPRPVCLY